MDKTMDMTWKHVFMHGFISRVPRSIITWFRVWDLGVLVFGAQGSGSARCRMRI